MSSRKNVAASRKPLFVLLALTMFNTLATNMPTPTLYLYAMELGASLSYVAIIASTATAAMLIQKFPVGLFSDRFGRRPLLRLGSLVTSIALLILYIADSPSLILLGAILNKISSDLVFTVGLTMVSEISENKTSDISLFALITNVAFFLGPALSAVLLLVVGIRETYLVGSLIEIGAVLCSIPLISRPSSRRTLNVKRSLRNVFGNENVRFAMTSRIFLALALTSVLVFLPLYLANRYQFTPAQISFLLSLYALATTFSVAPVTRMLRTMTEEIVAGLGLMIYALTLLGMSYGNNLVQFSILTFLAGLAHGITYPCLAMIVSRADRLDLGLANAAYLAVNDMVSIVTPLGFVLLIQALGYGSLYVVSSIVVFIGLLHALTKGRRRPVRVL